MFRVAQGDGTAAIFAGDPSVFTLSVHCAAQSFPEPGHASDLDLALPAGTGDEAYMQVPSFRVRPQNMQRDPIRPHHETAERKTPLVKFGWVPAGHRKLTARPCINQSCIVAMEPLA